MSEYRASYKPWFRATQLAVLALFGIVSASFFLGPSPAIEDTIKGLWLGTCAALVLLWLVSSYEWIEAVDGAVRAKRWLSRRIVEIPAAEVRAVVPMGFWRVPRDAALTPDERARVSAVRLKFQGRRSVLVFRATRRNFDGFLGGLSALMARGHPREDAARDASNP